MTADAPILAGMQEMYAQGLNGYFCNGKQREQGGWCQPGTWYEPESIAQPACAELGPHRDSIPQIVLDSRW
jgi:hypothetical protein